MSRLAPEKMRVFMDLKESTCAEYKGVQINLVVSEIHASARFEAKIGEKRIYDPNLKKLLEKIDRRLAGKKVKLDLPVFVESGFQGEPATLTTVNVDGSVNVMQGRSREKFDSYEIKRRLAHHTAENNELYGKIKEHSTEQYRLKREIDRLRQQITHYTPEEIELLVEAKLKED